MNKNLPQYKAVNGNKKDMMRQPQTMLEVAIHSQDEEYIKTLIMGKVYDEVATLSKDDKVALAHIVVRFLRTEYKLHAISLLNQIVIDAGSVEGVIKELISLQADFSKLAFLKGKIDFLKFKNKNKDNSPPGQSYIEP